jgi:hypothetical protein
MTTGTKVICTLRPRQDKKPILYTGTVIRVDAATEPEADGTGGWDSGIVVEYPKVKYRGQPCAIFHAWPSLWVREA